MKFTRGTDTLIFESPAQYPASRPVSKAQIIDRLASGVTDVESLGPDISERILEFSEMSKTDYDALRTWYLDIADGAINKFYFEDERGSVGEVIITSFTFALDETDYELFEGSITLEYV